MAFLEYKNVRIAGIAAGVPKCVFNNLELSVEKGEISSDYTPEAFIELTGVKQRRVSSTLCTSDLCYHAAEKLIADLNWDKSEIDAILFVSQTPDYILPATACILQDRLGLSKECFASDISLGCSGWVYGLAQAMALAQSGGIRKMLLLVGDAKRRVYNSVRDPLFGSAGTVTAIECGEGLGTYQFHFGTDGSGYDAIITPDGGSRNPVSEKTLVMTTSEGRPTNRMMARMKGMDVFSFGITTAPKSVKKLGEHFGFDYLSYDYYIFHQANMKMNNLITKKLKLPQEKVPSCMYQFGNTSSASIPLTIVSELKGKVEDKPTKFIACGFGVGLSWGTVAFETKGIFISDLVECEELTSGEKWV